jgi:hypothetical protein
VLTKHFKQQKTGLFWRNYREFRWQELDLSFQWSTSVYQLRRVFWKPVWSIWILSKHWHTRRNWALLGWVNPLFVYSFLCAQLGQQQ